MNDLVLYLLQSGISLIMLYTIYWLFLRKDTFFMMNRIYLVGAVLFSLLFPLLPINIPFANNETTYVVMLDTITINASTLESTIQHNLSLMQIISVIYFTGVSIFLVRFLFQMGQLFLMIRKQGVSHEQGLSIIFINRNYAPFSFFKLIFINRRELNEKNIKEIITHEKVHIRQGHSIDLIFLELLTIVQWFNPFVWLYRNSLKSIHEYLADEGVLLKGFDIINYQKLLLAKSTGVQVNDLTNNFNHSLIKKRIIMMTRAKSTFMARLKLLLVTPVALLLLVAFTASPMVKTMAQADDVVVTNKSKIEVQQKANEEDDVFMVVEEMPKYKGGTTAQMQYIASKVKYPEEARKAGKEGIVYVQFVVEKDGAVTGAKILRGFDKACDKQALDAISGMPNWIPGKQRGKPVRVQFNIPVKFSLGNGEKENKKGTDVKDPPPPPKQVKVIEHETKTKSEVPPPPKKEKK